MKLFAVVFALVFAFSAHGREIAAVEVEGLRLSVEATIVAEVTKDLKEVDRGTEFAVLLENRGTKPVVVPTKVSGESSIADLMPDGVLRVDFLFQPPTKDGKILRQSPYKLEPVELAPGEQTALPSVEVPIEAIRRAKRIVVVYSVEEHLAERNGWFLWLLEVSVEKAQIDTLLAHRKLKPKP